MADKPNLVKVVGRNDGKFKVRILSATGKILAESDKVYATKGSAKTAAKSLVTKPLELDEG